MLPDVDGFAVCKRIRQNNNTPIIIVSAKGEKEDKLNGLMIGADDYIEKPYDIDILLAKINGIFKRRYDNDIISCGNIKIDTTRRTVYVNDIEIKMTVKEYELLAYLMKNMEKRFQRKQFLMKYGVMKVSPSRRLLQFILNGFVKKYQII